MLSDIPAQLTTGFSIDFQDPRRCGSCTDGGRSSARSDGRFLHADRRRPAHLRASIAAANAISDVYAMGGRPLTALAIACFPQDSARPATSSARSSSAASRNLREAGVSLLGGHTVRDQEIKFGYAVTGAVDPEPRAGRTPARSRRRARSSPSRSAPASSARPSSSIASTDRARRMRPCARCVTLNRAAAEASQALPAGARARVHRRHRLRFDRSQHARWRPRSRGNGRDRSGAGAEVRRRAAASWRLEPIGRAWRSNAGATSAAVSRLDRGHRIADAALAAVRPANLWRSVDCGATARRQTRWHRRSRRRESRASRTAEPSRLRRVSGLSCGPEKV